MPFAVLNDTSHMKRQLLDVVASYDIVNDQRRTKLANLLEEYGTRVQYSVFELTLKPRELKQLRQQAARLLKDETDSIRYYVLCHNCMAERTVDVLPKRNDKVLDEHNRTTKAT